MTLGWLLPSLCPLEAAQQRVQQVDSLNLECPLAGSFSFGKTVPLL